MKSLKYKEYSDINPFYHGIMFHHFHNGKQFKKNYSSISKKSFLKIINYLGKKNINNANDFLEKLNQKKINQNDLCLTFDDALKSQIKIVLPILDINIRAFFFIYTEIYEKKNTNLMELTRDFIQTKFLNFDEFFDFFLENLKKYKNPNKINYFFKKNNLKIKKMKITYNFYSLKEIKYRLIRDNFFKIKSFNSFMLQLFKKRNYQVDKRYKEIFMSKTDRINLVKKGHVIGLHSHTHPHNMSGLKFKNQKNEYQKNYLYLKKISKAKSIISMSHPTGSYNKNLIF